MISGDLLWSVCFGAMTVFSTLFLETRTPCHFSISNFSSACFIVDTLNE